MKTLVIAEAGVNHNGKLELALELVRQAAATGADLVKFQSFVTGHSIARQAQKADYQLQTTNPEESQFEMVRKLELSRTDHEELIRECNRAGIGFFSTAFDTESFEMLLSMGLDRIKVPSGEITNLPFLRYLARSRLPVILSTGMAVLGEVEAAIAVFEAEGLPRHDITVLHCNTEYPTPMSDVNLKAMQSMGQAFGVRYGYSDHTQGIEIPIAAVALGATVIEKHFTLDRHLPGPDHQASLEPDQFKAMVMAIRNVEQALGDGIKRPTASERPNLSIVRKSIVAARPIQVGETFSPDNVTTKRPGSGISPMSWDDVIGQQARRSYLPDELIER